MKSLHLKLKKVAEYLGASPLSPTLESLAGKLVFGVSTDSRTVGPGEIFVTLSGENFDGHAYLETALSKGALAVVSQHQVKGAVFEKTLRVPDTLRALGQLAHNLRTRRPLKVIGITGSNGKTTTKEMVATIMAKCGPILATEGNFNNLVGLPLTLLKLSGREKTAILEMGMNHFGEIARLTEIASPDVGLVTSVNVAHLAFFGTLSRVAKAKGELYRGLKPEAVAVVNADEPLLRREARHFSGNRLTFGSGPEADLRLKKLKSHGLSGQSFTLYGPGAEKGRQIFLKILGSHNAQNAAAAAAAALAAGADWDMIESGLGEAENFPGRLAPFKTAQGGWIIDDTYNANPASMTAGLKFLAGLPGRAAKGAILGDMMELGAGETGWHRSMGSLAADLKLDFLAVVGDCSKVAARAAIKSGLSKTSVASFDRPEDAAHWVLKTRPKTARVLIKGSRSMRMEKAANCFKEDLN